MACVCVGGALVTVLERTAVHIGMQLPCDYQSCVDHAEPLYRQLAVPHYSLGASVMPCPDSLEEWQAEHRTARKRAWRSERLGYTFAEVDYSQHSDDLFVINTSLTERQGRPMTAGYTSRRAYGPLSAAQTRCVKHRTHTYGVLTRHKLVAYMTLHRAGDLAMVSTILGHGDHLRNDIMYLLCAGMIDHQAGKGGILYYNLHSSGTEGLVYFKERIGFRAADLEWSLS